MATTKKLMGTTAVGGAAAFTAIEDVFSTYLYTGNSSTQTITNGIDLAGEGGLVWVKNRSTATTNHLLFDTERGALKPLRSNTTGTDSTTFNTLTSFNSDGFSLGNRSDEDATNASSSNYASWAFRKAPRFFDVVTYTGTGTVQNISHNLGVEPGCIIVKRTDISANWIVYHRGVAADAETDYLVLNTNAAAADLVAIWNDTAPTNTQFTVNTAGAVNGSGGTYVAYLFAHDPLGPSGDGSDGLIACGSYTGNGSTTGPVIDLGWEPQWLLVKGATSGAAYDWRIHDIMRGFTADGNGAKLEPNTSDAEDTAECRFRPLPTGFQPTSNVGVVNASGETYIYIAIRRGPMRQPTSGTEVFAVDNGAGVGSEPAFDSPFPVDFVINKDQFGSATYVGSRLQGPYYLQADATNAETDDTGWVYDHMDGFYKAGGAGQTNDYAWMFRRAPGFFDGVAYSGDGTSNRAIPHNLGVTPELTIVKVRNAADNWFVTKPEWVPSAQGLRLNSSGALGSGYSWITGVSNPSDTNFYVSSNSAANGSGLNYIMYHFASCPGVSKVGSYTGNGSSQTIDCGFTSGTRFVLIKNYTTPDSWYVWDSARGIVAGNDPYLRLDTIGAEGTTDDWIDPDASGFALPVNNKTNENGTGYIYLAIA